MFIKFTFAHPPHLDTFFKDIVDNPNSKRVLIVFYKTGGIHDVRLL